MDERILNHEMHALEFVLGRVLNVELLYGIHGDCNVIAYAGNHVGYRNMPRHAADRPPVGYEMEHAPTAAFFSALCGMRDLGDEALVRRCIGLYIDSLGGYMEVQSLMLNVAAESMAWHLWRKESTKEPPKVYLSLDHKKWIDWCDEHQKNIRELARPDKGEDLLQAVRRADGVAASRIVAEVCSHLGLAIDDTMKNAIKARNKVVHEGTLKLSDDIDQDIILIDAPRTILIAFIAKLVGYRGPILGYHSRAVSGSPEWWIEGEMPPSAQQRYLFTSRALAPTTPTQP